MTTSTTNITLSVLGKDALGLLRFGGVERVASALILEALGIVTLGDLVDRFATYRPVGKLTDKNLNRRLGQALGNLAVKLVETARDDAGFLPVNILRPLGFVVQPDGSVDLLANVGTLDPHIKVCTFSLSSGAIV